MLSAKNQILFKERIFMNNKMSALTGFMLGVVVTVLLIGIFFIATPISRECFFDNGFNITREQLSAQSEMNPITFADIVELQTAWGEGLVAISTAYAYGENHASIAQSVLDTLYGYVDGVVLFKPTIAQEVPFRFTESAAASYFIGGSIDEDTGFALNAWTAVRFGDDGQHIINGETALWMGSVFLTNGAGEEVRVEKSLGLYRDSNGDVRIQLHHSSVPFSE